MQAIHSVGWHHEGKQFMCSHSDGSLTMWNLRNTTKPIQITFPHGEELQSFKSIAAKDAHLICRIDHIFIKCNTEKQKNSLDVVLVAAMVFCARQP